ncbi:MAG: ATP-binding protein [Candidatus Parvarchaeota archaeon]|nr:ATP-binding protein [Candidatus Parvarchaeota archaeon]
MERDAIKQYLINKKEELRNLKIKDRDVKFEISEQFVTVIIGARRSGKTYSVLNFLLNKLKLRDQDFLYLNMEDVELDGFTNKDILDAVGMHQQLYGKLPKFIYIDEPQVVKGWEKAIYSLHEKRTFKVILTGSSSKLLSKEIASSLRGRSLTYTVYPLSFEEYMSFNGFTIEKETLPSTSAKNQILYELSRYLTIGSLPDVVISPSIAPKLYADYIDLIIFRDIVERFGIKNIGVIRFVIKSLMLSFSKQSSIHSLYRALKGSGQKVSKKILYAYISLLEDAYFAFQLKKFNFSRKKAELSLPKIYLNDWGAASTVLSLDKEIGRAMENAVFIELKRRQQHDESLYYSDAANEIDFIRVKKEEVRELIQVTYASSRNEIKDREVRSMLEGAKRFRCNDLTLITWDYEAVEKVENKTINFIPLWKWLLNRANLLPHGIK